MKNDSNSTNDLFEPINRSLGQMMEWNSKFLELSFNKMTTFQLYWKGVLQYTSNFTNPAWAAMQSFKEAEEGKRADAPSSDTIQNYFDLFWVNWRLAATAWTSSLSAASSYHTRHMGQAFDAMINTLFDREGEDIYEYLERQRDQLDLLVNSYPKAISDIESEYGLHPEKGGCVKVAETDRYFLYQVLPYQGRSEVMQDAKPVLIIPPYVLGPDILSFLPGENRSYVHSYANLGIPTYIRIVKDIDTTPAVQLLTGEDDALDTRYFCEQTVARHGKPVTLNGFCQGGYISLLDVLSGELDGLVDALITCVAPMDGTRSKSLVDYIGLLPPRFRDLGYAVKTLPNGNKVVDGTVMSWVYKLMSIDKEAPLVSFYRDLMMFEKPPGQAPKINKTAAAINHWITYDRTDLPLGITKMSFASYTVPVDKDGTLPVRLFDRALNFKRLQEKGVKWLICIAEKDDLIDEPAALAPLDFIDAEVSVFPKGHGAMATSWSLPTSECALHTTFNTKSLRTNGKSRGPVRFHLDLDQIPLSLEAVA